MTSSDLWDAETAARYDESSAFMFTPEVLDPAVSFLAGLAGDGDMATTRVPGEFSVVYVVWNSIGNLRTQEEQVACFRNAARHLAPGGRFVVELWVPGIRRASVTAPATSGTSGRPSAT